MATGRADDPRQYRWVKQNHLATDEFLDIASNIQREDAAEKAVELGILNGKEGSLTRPARENVGDGHGKIVKARYKDPKRRRKVDKETGEITEPKVVDPTPPSTRPAPATRYTGTTSSWPTAATRRRTSG